MKCFIRQSSSRIEKGAIKKISNAITNENVLKLMHREEKRGISGYNLLLYISFFINAAIFVYLIGDTFYKTQGWKYYQDLRFWMVCAV